VHNTFIIKRCRPTVTHEHEKQKSIMLVTVNGIMTDEDTTVEFTGRIVQGRP